MTLMLANPYRELQKKLMQLEDEKRSELLAAMSRIKAPEEQKDSEKMVKQSSKVSEKSPTANLKSQSTLN